MSHVFKCIIWAESEMVDEVNPDKTITVRSQESLYLKSTHLGEIFGAIRKKEAFLITTIKTPTIE